ncbi:pilus assembly protein [Affinibrenneria salicis]|uniref:Pilus assembly protein n=1 Tax=Affinibrenneria salicis TaxID=2590031 RepID=A0A5J5FZX5_9GAMM|nr:pilus assembly protein [Affinibrenneria salicis]KAA8999456.1 pilus assembly protein [Affinibrenneria salicis]
MTIFFRYWSHLTRRMGRDSRGMVAIEAALVIPLAVFFIIASWELYQYFRTASVVDRTAFMVANSLAMQRDLKDGDSQCTLANAVCTYNAIAADLMTPLDYKSRGGMVISLYEVETDEDGNNPVWKSSPQWQKIYRGGDNSRDLSSRLTPPEGFPDPATNDTVIAVEVVYHYSPFVMGAAFWQALGGEKQVSSRVFYRPRFSALRTLSE